MNCLDDQILNDEISSILEDIEDGLGGHLQTEKFVCARYANVEELSLETTIKIYGEAITQNVKAIVLGDIKEKIDKIFRKCTKEAKSRLRISSFNSGLRCTR